MCILPSLDSTLQLKHLSSILIKLNLTEMLAHMNKGDFASMGVQQFGQQPWENLPCGSKTTIDKGGLINISGIH
jgi:hypothetical protein